MEEIFPSMDKFVLAIPVAPTSSPGVSTSPTSARRSPRPAVLHPELLKSLPDEQPKKRQSCADLAIRDPQSLTINTVIAAHMADYLLRLVVTKDLRRFATYIDMDSGSVRSLAITPTQVQRSTPTLSTERIAR